MPRKNTFLRDSSPAFLAIATFASLGAFTVGYDGGWWGLLIGAPYFNEMYGSYTTTTDGVASTALSATEQSLATSLPVIGTLIGIMVTPIFSERFGRKATFLLLAVVNLIGSAIQGSSTAGTRLVVMVLGKAFISAGIGIGMANIGVYLSECSPASIRGFALAFYSITQNIGYMLSAGVTWGVINRTDYWQWIIIILVQIPVPFAIILAAPFLVESPRWLVSKGRTEDAVNSLRRLRGNHLSDFDLREEVDVIKAGYDAQKQLHAGIGWIELFRGKNAYRTMVAVGVQCLQIAQGTSFVANYMVLTFETLGFSDTYEVLFFLYMVLFVASTVGFYVPDRFGRRPLLLWGGAILACCMATMAAISTVYETPTGSLANLLIASIFIWVAVFAVTWSPMGWTIPAEISSNPLREKTLAVAAFGGMVVNLIVTLVVPYIQNAQYGNLGAKIGYIWMAFSIIGWLFAFFLVPELKGRSLEEVDLMFEANVPIREFTNYDATELLARNAPVTRELEEKQLQSKEIGHFEEHQGETA